jgi:TonB family protein
MKRYFKLHSFFWVSLGAHLIVLMIIGLKWIRHSDIVNPEDSYVSVYAYSGDTRHSAVNNEIKHKSMLNLAKSALVHVATKVNEKASTRARTVQSDSQSQRLNKANQDEIHRLLLKILHEEIAAKQVYPENALALNQNGKVTIGFTLNSAGLIQNVNLIKSSGVESIDSAALAAVQAVPPLQNKQITLTSNEYFAIDVIFA